jgi:hypothetical protein
MNLARPLRCLFATTLCVVSALAVFSSPAWASHDRATQLSWTEGADPGEAIFNVEFVARRSYYGEPNKGETITDPVIEFGDGESISPALTVIEIDGDIIYTRGQAVHTYATSGPYTATMGSCCRLSASSGHVNNGDLYYSVHTLVDLARASSSPNIAVAPIVFCPTSGNCSFAFAGNGADAGNHLRWRFATPTETGDASFAQPGPPYAPNAATIDPNLGRVSWETTGATLSPGELPTYYSTQVVAEELNSAGELVSDAAADFFIALDDNHNEQPDCEDTDSNGLVDNDEDGLCDNWETSGIDVDDDDAVDFVLPVSADPNKPDIFVEVDYMSGREPQAAALGDVVAAFDRHGIALHVLVDEEVPFATLIKFGSECSPCGSSVEDFDAIKSAYFGTEGDRIAPNSAEKREARSFVYHYAIYANKLLGGAPSTSGKAELPGNDLTITLGNSAWRTGVNNSGPPKRRDEAGTFMHELGHNLSLMHGGNDGVGCKPNYLSVMNYSRQTTGLITAQLDYSDAVLPTLDENGLNEFLGVQGPSGAQVVFGPGVHIGGSTGSIDWNGKNGTEGNVAVDVNNVGNQCDPSPGQSLVGWDDWANLALAFQATADFSDGVHSTLPLQEPEVAAEDLSSYDDDQDGIPNIQDECPGENGSAVNSGCPAKESTATTAQQAPPPPGVSRSAAIGPPRTLLSKVTVKRKQGRARFAFGGESDSAGLAFECKLDRGRFKPCRSPKSYSGLKPGRHVFRARAVDSSGQVDQTPVVKPFRISSPPA